MTVIRSLVIVTAICLCGTSASALTMDECRAKYNAAQVPGKLVMKWADFQEKQCGINTKATAPTPPREKNRPPSKSN